MVRPVLDADETRRLLGWMERAIAEPEDGEPLHLYALLDGARDERVAPMVRGFGARQRCLFDGDLHPALAAAAPYIVALDPDAAATRALLAAAWGSAWGVFVAAPVGLDALRHHFRRFLRVADEQGRQLVFRYYDPRVLRLYLPTCTEAELELVFGPVRGFLIEDEDPARGAQMRRGGGALVAIPRA